jgi:hypothetical protein
LLYPLVIPSSIEPAGGNPFKKDRRARRKGPMSAKKTDKASDLSGFWESALGALKSVGSLRARAEKSFEKYKNTFERWIVRTAVMGLSVFMSLAFLVLGLFFIAIDYGGIPRGVVFTCGGLLGLLVLRLMSSSKE